MIIQTNTKDDEFIQSIKDEVVNNLMQLGWCKGAFENDGKYCLIGMLRGVVLDSISEQTAEYGEAEMDIQEKKWYRDTLEELCRCFGLFVNYESVESMQNALYEYNDRVESLDELLSCLR